MRRYSILFILLAVVCCSCGMSRKAYERQRAIDLKYLDRQNDEILACLRGELTPDETGELLKGWREVRQMEIELLKIKHK